MKKLIALLLAVLMLLSFAACDKKDEKKDEGKKDAAAENGGEDTDKAPAVEGETYDAGNVTVLVPEGWLAVPVEDFMSSDDSTAMNPDQVNVVMDGTDETSVWFNPYLNIIVYEKGGLIEPNPEYYNEGKLVDPITTGDVTWNVIEAQDLMGNPLMVLWSSYENAEVCVNVYKETSNGAIDMADAEVLAILASITPEK